MATSTAQTIPLIEVYDYILTSGDAATATTSKGLKGRKVKVTLQYDKALTIAPDAVVWVPSTTTYSTDTDANGFWHLFLTPNNKISPANTYYSVEVEGGLTYQIQVTDVSAPAIGWQSSAPGILLNVPSALAPTTSTVGAITATGLITAQAGINVSAGATIAGGLTVTGGETETGGLTVDKLSFSSAAGQIVPGATSLSWRNNANNADNLIITDAGNATVRGSLTVTTGPLTVTAGGLTVSAGGASITGNSTVTGTLTVTSTSTFQNTLTVSAGGMAITGNSTVTGGLTVTSTLALTGAPGVIGMQGAGSATLIGGTTGMTFANNANNAANMSWTDAGLATLRNALLIPPSAGAGVAPNAYATVPVKLDDQSGAGPSASVTLTVPAGALYRNLLVTFIGRGDSAAGNVTVQAQFNADVGANYTYSGKVVVGTGTAFTDVSAVTQTSARIASIAAANDLAGVIGEVQMWILNADSATQRKMFQTQSFSLESATEITSGLSLEFDGGQWDNTANAMTSIKLFPGAGNFVNYRATLWGFS